MTVLQIILVVALILLVGIVASLVIFAIGVALSLKLYFWVEDYLEKHMWLQ